MANATYGPKAYREQGGDRFVVASGGSADVESGGEIDIESGGALKIAGTAVTASAAELNTMTGITASAAELNLNDGTIAGTSVASKTLALGANKNTDVLVLPVSGLKIGAGAGTAVTASAAELNTLTGITADVGELNLIDGSIAGTSVASKALALGANKNTDILALPVSGLKIGAGAGTAVDRTAAELNLLAQGVAAGYKLARGVLTTVDEDDTVVTGLTTVVAVTATLGSDPVAGCQFVTATIGDQAGAPAAGSVQIKTWKATAAGDTALIAATTFSKLVNWIAVGT